ncbi:MAG: hypothetical protein Q4P07_10625 [Ornithinimicrobium sp.]|uniref:hypothetical protein n=1 Tax=Ornithinimicrobium sp. TaxID=1977084 RepID=UPI0026E0132B|nr:hypothetical protein [Ornithinimicrobium sp.]MDO5740590.1 hypothetical protein [Ornithinimicrobium sp.]
MKILASVLTLVLAGLLGGWLFVDATAQARQETPGVLITGPVDPGSATSLVEAGSGPGSASRTGQGDTAAATRTGTADLPEADRVVSVLRDSSGELFDRADKTRREHAKEATAAKEAKEAGSGDGSGGIKAVPVQPAPVNPGGWCEWDDGVWECDDWDDELDEWDD